jgi:hypothetical protein
MREGCKISTEGACEFCHVKQFWKNVAIQLEVSTRAKARSSMYRWVLRYHEDLK